MASSLFTHFILKKYFHILTLWVNCGVILHNLKIRYFVCVTIFSFCRHILSSYNCILCSILSCTMMFSPPWLRCSDAIFSMHWYSLSFFNYGPGVWNKIILSRCSNNVAVAVGYHDAFGILIVISTIAGGNRVLKSAFIALISHTD